MPADNEKRLIFDVFDDPESKTDSVILVITTKRQFGIDRKRFFPFPHRLFVATREAGWDDITALKDYRTVIVRRRPERACVIS